jgi:hypothetical protein
MLTTAAAASGGSGSGAERSAVNPLAFARHRTGSSGNPYSGTGAAASRGSSGRLLVATRGRGQSYPQVTGDDGAAGAEAQARRGPPRIPPLALAAAVAALPAGDDERHTAAGRQ